VGAGAGEVAGGVVVGAGVLAPGAGLVAGAGASSFLLQALSATASTEAIIKVLLIIFRLL
jgi:predicted ATP-dependent serine protease